MNSSLIKKKILKYKTQTKSSNTDKTIHCKDSSKFGKLLLLASNSFCNCFRGQRHWVWLSGCAKTIHWCHGMSPIKKENATLIFIGTNLIITAALRLHYQKMGKLEGSHNTKDATQEQCRMMRLELKSKGFLDIHKSSGKQPSILLLQVIHSGCIRKFQKLYIIPF